MEENKTRICKICGKTFELKGKHNNSQKFCSDECRKINANNSRHLFNIMHRNAVTHTLNENSINGIDYVECPICHEKHSQITLLHFKRHGYTSREQIFTDFPNLQMTCKKQIEKHLIGNNNPMSKEKTTTLKRKQSSPYSIEHYLLKHNGDIKLAKEELQKFLDSIDRSSWIQATSIKYYTRQGYTESEAKEIIHKKYKTNGLDFYIKKYGKDIGQKMYNERIHKWSKKLKGITHSQRADLCIQKILNGNTDGMLFGDNEFICKSPLTHNIYKIDLTNIKNNRMIEFYGDYWHCNPLKYNETYFNKKMKKTAKEIWEHDKIRINHLKTLGFDVMIIWEHDYVKNHDSIIKEAQDFIFYDGKN